MLENWFNPVPKSLNAKRDNSFGKKLQIHQNSFPALKHSKVALVGLDAASANAIRAELYAYLSINDVQVADLGNVKKKNVDFLIPIFHELLRSKIIPVVIGKAYDKALAQFLAYREAKSLVNYVLVDSKIDLNEEANKKILSPKHPLLFHFGGIGLHRHELSYQNIEQLANQDFDLIRLGKSHADIEICEPIIRDADYLTFNMRALKGAEAPAVTNQSPGGYTIEEACQLTRYAGLSDKLNAFGLYGYDNKLSGAELTAQVSAQLIWYFIDGVAKRTNDYPASKDGLLEYLVEFREYDFPITFWKSTRSGRWWVQVVQKTKRNIKRHQLVPCAYGDYQLACSGELSDRIVNAMHRFA